MRKLLAALLFLSPIAHAGPPVIWASSCTSGIRNLSTNACLVEGGGGSAAWGMITGTLSSQTDLQTALNGKQAAGSYITALTGDVIASGPNSAAATISNLAITNAKIANGTIDLTTKVTGVSPEANGGTGASSFTPGSVIFGDTSTLTQDNSTLFWDNVKKRLFIGSNPTISGPGPNGQISIESFSGSDHAINAICRTTNNCLEIQSQSAFASEFTTSSNTANTGAYVNLARSRGTINSKSQMMAGDAYGGLTFQGYYSTSSNAGFGAAISAVATENITASGSGGELVFQTSANGSASLGNIPLILDNNNNALFGGEVLIGGATSASNASIVFKNGHVKSTQTTAPTATVNANAGTGATCTVSNATDMAGTINLTTTATASASGVQCAVNFNKAYNVAPICSLTPANSAAATLAVSSGVYVSSSTSVANVNFATTDVVGHAYVWAYKCVETQ